MIFDSSLDRKDFFSTRVCLVAKPKPGEYRPVQVSNSPLRIMEKSIYSIIRHIKLKNSDHIHEFSKGKSTHTAYVAVQERLTTTKDVCLFVDMSKAYNSLRRDILIDLVEKRVEDRIARKLIIQIITKQNCNIADKYFACTKGVAQGSIISPWLFNLLMDSIIEDLKTKLTGMTDIVAYADDLAVFGGFKPRQLISIL